jgi:hypothetical protein
METRSSINYETLQESLDAGGDGNNNQYETPPSLAAELMARLPFKRPSTIFDPQVAGGALVNCAEGWPQKFGIEIDHNKTPGGVHVISGNCMKVFEAVEELTPELRFMVANANPPFGLKWKTKDGDTVDSTLATWRFVTRHANCGFFIANASTIEKFGLNHAVNTTGIEVVSYERRPACEYWKGIRSSLMIGIVLWQRKDTTHFTPASMVTELWKQLKGIIDEEKLSRPKFNIYLDKAGFLKTYLSQRSTFKLKLTKEQITRLHRVNDCHPLTLTTEKETRVLMRQLVDCGLYTLQPEALDAIEKALADVNSLACPIMPVNDFETVAYAEEEERLVCRMTTDSINGVPVSFTAGKSYSISTGSYSFVESFKRNKVHFNEEHQETYTQNHECQLSGTDRYIAVTDDSGAVYRFMDRPGKDPNEFPEKLLWEYFAQPKVRTVADVCREVVNQNHAILKACEMLAGYTYYEGQMDYLARVAVKDAALVAAATGVGKTLLAISLIAMKSPQRSLIIAPQGTMRASKVEDEDLDEEQLAEMSAAQWFKELKKFAPYLQVWEIFSYEDYQNILSLNGGKLPYGVYVTYYEAFFTNGAIERAPSSWDDDRLDQWAKANKLASLPEMKDSLGAVDRHYWCDRIGKEVEGVRCVLQPSLSTLIGDQFDCVIVDEIQRCKGMDSLATSGLIRLQPRLRYGLSATPVSNTVVDLFPLLGWLAVPEWYKGDRRNAAWPYAREDIGRFNSTFLTQERDLTQEDLNRVKDPKRRDKCIKDSPIISSPARLLKLLKPNMAYISKEQCRADYIKPRIVDVRVPMGRAQAKLYGYFTNRANIPASNPLVRARKQTAYLRNICADPAGFTHGGPKVHSNLNPKVIAILELVRDILGRGEQVVIINSRVGITSTILNKLAEAGVPIARIDSTQSAEQHSYQANVFKSGKARVLGMGIKCAAAYSFDDCQNLIIGSLEYSWGTFGQACGRIDRVTNKSVKNIYVILHRHSIEEIIFDVCAIKGDAANLCLRGQRIPRDFKPVDSSEILAKAIDRFDLSGSQPETECEQQWPKLCKAISLAACN